MYSNATALPAPQKIVWVALSKDQLSAGKRPRTQASGASTTGRRADDVEDQAYRSEDVAHFILMPITFSHFDTT